MKPAYYSRRAIASLLIKWLSKAVHSLHGSIYPILTLPSQDTVEESTSVSNASNPSWSLNQFSLCSKATWNIQLRRQVVFLQRTLPSTRIGKSLFKIAYKQGKGNPIGKTLITIRESIIRQRIVKELTNVDHSLSVQFPLSYSEYRPFSHETGHLSEQLYTFQEKLGTIVSKLYTYEINPSIPHINMNFFLISLDTLHKDQNNFLSK